MQSAKPADELAEDTLRLLRFMCAEVERLAPVEQRDTFYRNAIERALLLEENSE